MKGEKVVKRIKAFVRKRNPDVRVEGGPAAPPYKAITSGPNVEAAKSAIQFAFGKTLVFVREGGTIGAVLSMEQILNCPIVFLACRCPSTATTPRTRTTTGARPAAASSPSRSSSRRSPLSDPRKGSGLES
jgi:hypothetical protein